MQDVQNDSGMNHDTHDLSINNYKKKFIALIQGERSVHADLLKRYVRIIYSSTHVHTYHTVVQYLGAVCGSPLYYCIFHFDLR